VLFDDRDDRVGVMLADQELLGIPLRIVIGERGLKEGLVELQGRRDAAAAKIPLAEVVGQVREKLAQA
ncbi:MAG: proline--tRNA ligase, partial [Betaproteobacteria bacterium]|nr:proline--tRNA ligase [Betaproteobacteria bacterium]